MVGMPAFKPKSSGLNPSGGKSFFYYGLLDKIQMSTIIRIALNKNNISFYVTRVKLL